MLPSFAASPIGHSPGVAELAAAAARFLGLPAGDVEFVRRAGLLHHLGRVGVANGIWEKPARLTDPEWEQQTVYRPALDAATAKARHRDEVAAGRLDGQASDAVLAAAGHRVRRTRQDWPAGLTTREVKVLRHAVRGASNRQIGKRLHISERTVEHHLSHSYVKIGVSSRAAAALFASQSDLLQD